MEYNVCDFVFLEVSLMHGMTRFGIRGKLAPRYMGLVEITERVDDVSYHLRLPLQLGHVHDVHRCLKSTPVIRHMSYHM